MKQVKQVTAFLLLVVLVFSLSACSGSTDKEQETQAEKKTETTSQANDDKKDKSEEKEKAEVDGVKVMKNGEEVVLSKKEQEKFIVEGYSLGEIPAIPTVEIPTLADNGFKKEYSEEQNKVAEAIEAGFAKTEGIRIEPALFAGGAMVYMPTSNNNGNGRVVDLENKVFVEKNDKGSSYTDSSDGSYLSLEKNKDGSANYYSQNENENVVMHKKADGSSSFRDNNKNITIEKDADGNGTYSEFSDGKTIIFSKNIDGSGSYSSTIDGKELSIDRKPDGTGRYRYNDDKAAIGIDIDAKDKAYYSDDSKSIICNYQDAKTAEYSDDKLTIRVADGMATISTKENFEEIKVKAKELAEVPLLGELPEIEEIPQIGEFEIKGFRVIFDDAILFDFDQHELRPEGKEIIRMLVDQINNLNIEQIEIHGHTDSMSDTAYNQTLSEKRAASVDSFTKEVGIKAVTTAKGYGETKPVAPNTNADGSDNPAGRQANRRVEIFIPVN